MPISRAKVKMLDAGRPSVRRPCLRETL